MSVLLSSMTGVGGSRITVISLLNQHIDSIGAILPVLLCSTWLTMEGKDFDSPTFYGMNF